MHNEYNPDHYDHPGDAAMWRKILFARRAGEGPRSTSTMSLRAAAACLAWSDGASTPDLELGPDVL
jgi:hypothetical protein